MQNKIFIITIFFTLFVNAQSNNLALSTAVTDEYHGIKVLDQYRNLENLKDPVTISWMKSQTDYANSVLSSISNRNYYLNKRLDFDKRAGYSVSDLRLTSNDKYFYLKRNVGEKSAKVYYRKGYNGSEISVLLFALRS